MEKGKTASSKTVIHSLALASFLHDMGSDIVFSIWPLFVTEVMRANMSVLGFIDGVGDAMVSISQAFSGYASDRLKKRKLFVWLGYLFGGISRIGYSLAPTWGFLIPFRMLDRSGKIRGAPRDAIISDLSEKSNRGRNFGFLRTMDNAGAVVGILLSIALLKILGYRTLFFLAAIPSIVAVLLLLLKLPADRFVSSKLHGGIRIRDLNANLWLFTILSALFSLASFSYSFLLIFAKKNGVHNIYIPVLYLLFTLIASVFSLPFGKLSDPIGRKKVLYLSFFFWSIVALLFFRSTSIVSIVAGFIFYGLHRAAIEPVQKTFVAELAPKQYVASILGGYQMIVGLFSLPASVMAGLLWDRVGMQAPFLISFFLTLSASIMLKFVKETR